MTLGEDTADNGGTRIALMALKEALAHEGKEHGQARGAMVSLRASVSSFLMHLARVLNGAQS